MIAAFALASLLGAAVDMNGAVYAEGRTSGATDSSGTVREGTVSPLVGLSALGRISDLHLDYSPRFSFVEGQSGTQILHRGTLQAGWSASPLTRLVAAVSATAGETEFSPLAGVAPPDPQLATLTASYLRTDSSLRLEHGFTERVRGTIFAGWQYEGGLGRDRALIPLRQTELVGGTLASSLTRVDTLEGRLAGSLNEAAGTRIAILEGTSIERHQFTRAWSLGVEAGAAGTLRTSPRERAVYPVAGLVLDLRPPVQGTPAVAAALRARVAPSIDRYTGDAYERLESSASLLVQVTQPLSFSATASGNRTLSGAFAGDMAAGLDVFATVAMAREVRLSVGGRGAYIDQQSTATQQFQWSAVVAVSAGVSTALPSDRDVRSGASRAPGTNR
jgi:hypothetical protein